jgi:hypothetical protein
VRLASGHLLSFSKHPHLAGAEDRPERESRIRADLSDGVFLKPELGRNLSVRGAPERFKHHPPASPGGQSAVAQPIAMAQENTVAAAAVVHRPDADAEFLGDALD